MNQQTTDASVTPDMITAAIVASDFHVLPGTQITVCTLTLRNGAKVLGYNYGAIDPARQDWEQGKQAAYDMAREKVWELEGYALRERLYQPAMVPEAAAVNAKIAALVRAFLDKHQVRFPASIYGSDSVREEACGLLNALAQAAGYYDSREDLE